MLLFVLTCPWHVQSPLSNPNGFLTNWELKGGVTTKTRAIINNGGGDDNGSSNNYNNNIKEINTVNTANIVCIFSKWNYVGNIYQMILVILKPYIIKKCEDMQLQAMC
jgi:hypothetical protein